MVCVMKHISYILLLFSVSFLYILLVTSNSFLVSHTYNLAYATTSQQEDPEEDQTSPANDDNSDKVNTESESSQRGIADSDQSDNNSNRNDDNDDSSTDQNSNCPNDLQNSNIPLYIGQDGCQYPCPSIDGNDEVNIPEGCSIEPSSSPKASTEFSVKEENTAQTPSQEQQQVELPQQQQQQQNSQDNSNQNAFVSPSINSDSSTSTFNNEAPALPEKDITSAGKLRSGTTQTESIIPLLPNDASKPFDPSKPFNSGSQTASISGFQGIAYLVIYSNFTHANIPPIAKYCVSTHSSSVIQSIRTEAQANPYCIDADFYGTLHTVQAPGIVEVKIIHSNFENVQTDCKFYIYPKESRSCMLNFINK